MVKDDPKETTRISNKKDTFESLWGSKSHFLVTFWSLLSLFTKGEKVSFLSLLSQINDFFFLGL